MDDPFSISPEGSSGPNEEQPALPQPESAPEAVSEPAQEALAVPQLSPLPEQQPPQLPPRRIFVPEFAIAEPASRRNFLHNLYLLLGLTLTAFTLTAWILVRVQSPFDLFSNGPQQVVRAQLSAVNRGQLRMAYDMFSDRYRQQVTFNEWHDLIVTHWRMFHAQVLNAGQLAQSGSRATLEIHLRGADDKPYRARFTLIRVGGRWWVDDLHWGAEPDPGSTLRT